MVTAKKELGDSTLNVPVEHRCDTEPVGTARHPAATKVELDAPVHKVDAEYETRFHPPAVQETACDVVADVAAQPRGKVTETDDGDVARPLQSAEG